LDTLHRKSRLNSLAAEENRYPLLSDIGVADGNMLLTAVQAGSVFVTPLPRTGVADGSTSLTAVQAGSVFGTPPRPNRGHGPEKFHKNVTSFLSNL
jgi:hypothetical protein